MTGNVQKRPVVYLDACFVSHWVGQDLDDPAQLAKHEATVACWQRMEGKMTPVLSTVVETEIAAGKLDGAAQRVRRIQGLPSWQTTPESEALTEELLRTGAVRKAKFRDAAHIAVAAVGGADILLSWNFRDIVNEKKMPEIKALVERAGYRCPKLVSPDKLPEVMP